MPSKSPTIAPRQCIRCGVQFTPRARNGVRCAGCRNRYKPLRRCRVCDTPLYRQKCPQRVVCGPCHERLRAQNRVYCRTCGQIGVLRRDTTVPLNPKRSIARCYDCAMRTQRPYQRQRYELRKSAGIKAPRTLPVYRHQTDAERTRIAALLDSGLTQRQVAAKLRLNVLRVRHVVRRGAAVSLKGRSDGSSWSEWLTQKELIRIFEHATVMRVAMWRSYGFPMRRYGTDHASGQAYMWVIHEDDLETWIQDRNSWVLWDMDDIVDDWWRAIALAARPPGSPGWLPIGVAASLWGLARSGAARRVTDGRYTGRVLKMRSTRWLWSEDVVAHALQHDGRVIVAPTVPRNATRYGTSNTNLGAYQNRRRSRQIAGDALRAVPVAR